MAAKKKTTVSEAPSGQLEIKRDEPKGKIWSHVRKKWLEETPEERVRQEYLCVLVNEYGYNARRQLQMRLATVTFEHPLSRCAAAGDRPCCC